MAPRRRIRPNIIRRKKASQRSKSRSFRKHLNKHRIDIKQVNTSFENMTTETNIPSTHKELDNNKLSTVERSNPVTVQFQKESLFVMNKIKDTGSQTEQILNVSSIKIEAVGREKRVELGGGVKRKRLTINTEKINSNEDLSDHAKSINNDLQKCLISCTETTKLLIFNLPNQFSEADVVHLFRRYKSLRSSYFVSTNNAVIVMNDSIEVPKVIKDYDGLLLHGSEQPLKINIMNVMRKYEYGSPLKLVHYQVVKHPSMFRERLQLSDKLM